VTPSLPAPPGGWPTPGRATYGAVIRFVSRGGGYHAAALTYYSILSFFPAAALALGLLGVVGADAAAEDVRRALADLSVEQQFVDALRATIRLAVDQRQAEATVVLVLSLAAAVWVAGRWVRGVARGLDGRPARPAPCVCSDSSGTLVLLFVGSVLSAFVGDALANDRR